MFSKETIASIRSAARAAGMDEAALLAVAEVESGGTAFAMVDGRAEPLIRFEGHYFDRRLSQDDRVLARAAGLASPTAGLVKNPVGQAARWRIVTRAVAIDRKAAYESVSWGLGQIMGAHWAWLGYANVDALVAEARSGVEGQARMMVRYIRKAGLAPALAAHDWKGFARGYNGPAYAKSGYDRKLAAAFARFSSDGFTAPLLPQNTILREGDRGSAVLALQQALSRLGAPLAADGVFGAQTEAALRAFQAAQGLAADGIAGSMTLAAIARLDRPAATAGLASRLMDWLARLFAVARA